MLTKREFVFIMAKIRVEVGFVSRCHVMLGEWCKPRVTPPRFNFTFGAFALSYFTLYCFIKTKGMHG